MSATPAPPRRTLGPRWLAIYPLFTVYALIGDLTDDQPDRLLRWALVAALVVCVALSLVLALWPRRDRR